MANFVHRRWCFKWNIVVHWLRLLRDRSSNDAHTHSHTYEDVHFVCHSNEVKRMQFRLKLYGTMLPPSSRPPLSSVVDFVVADNDSTHTHPSTMDRVYVSIVIWCLCLPVCAWLMPFKYSIYEFTLEILNENEIYEKYTIPFFVVSFRFSSSSSSCFSRHARACVCLCVYQRISREWIRWICVASTPGPSTSGRCGFYLLFAEFNECNSWSPTAKGNEASRKGDEREIETKQKKYILFADLEHLRFCLFLFQKTTTKRKTKKKTFFRSFCK